MAPRLTKSEKERVVLQKVAKDNSKLKFKVVCKDKESAAETPGVVDADAAGQDTSSPQEGAAEVAATGPSQTMSTASTTEGGPATSSQTMPTPASTTQESFSSQEFIEELNQKLNQTISVAGGDVSSQLAKGVATLAANGYFDVQKVKEPEKEDEEEEDDDDEASFWENVKKAGFTVPARAEKGYPIAGRWARRLAADAKLRQTYEETQGRVAKATFRQNWAREQYKSYLETKKVTEQHSVAEGMEGTMYSLERIAVEEGGGPAGTRNALQYAMSWPHWLRNEVPSAFRCALVLLFSV